MKRLLFLFGMVFAFSPQGLPLAAQPLTWMEVSCHPHYAKEGVGFDTRVKIYERGRWIATVTDNFLNGYGQLMDYGPQPDFATLGHAQRFWKGKDAIEVLEGGVFILLANVRDPNRRLAWFRKVKDVYESVFLQAAASPCQTGGGRGLEILRVFQYRPGTHRVAGAETDERSSHKGEDSPQM